MIVASPNQPSGMIPEGVTFQDVIALFDLDRKSSMPGAPVQDSLFKTLLGAGATPSAADEHAKFWMREYDYRSLCMLQLLLLLNRQNATPGQGVSHSLQCQGANRIADFYRGLEIRKLVGKSRLSVLVDDLTGSILSLFSSTVPRMDVKLKIDDASISPDKKRAVTALVGILTLRTLYNAACRQYSGSLQMRSGIAQGIYYVGIQMNTNADEILNSPDLEVISDLASILAANLVFRKTHPAETRIDLEFLIDDARPVETPARPEGMAMPDVKFRRSAN